MRLRNHLLRTAGFVTALVALGVACAVVVAGCGGSSTPTTSTSSTVSTTTPATGTSTTATGSFAAYQACLKSHGVSFPAGGGFYRRTTTTGVSTTTSGATTPTTTTPALSSAQQQAIAACASLRPTGGFASGGAFNSSNPAYAKFQACLKAHGVQTGSTVSRTSTTAEAAFAACRSLLPNGGTFAPGSTGASGAANSATFAKYQACLKSHGVQTGAAGQSASKLQTAIAACRSLLPNGGNSSPAATITTPTTTG